MNSTVECRHSDFLIPGGNAVLACCSSSAGSCQQLTAKVSARCSVTAFSPRAVAGDFRTGRQLLADAAADRHQTVSAMAACPRGRAELDTLAATVEVLACCPGWNDPAQWAGSLSCAAWLRNLAPFCLCSTLTGVLDAWLGLHSIWFMCNVCA